MVNKIADLDPRLRKYLHLISIVGTFMMLFGLTYLILQYTIGIIPWISNSTIFGDIPIEKIIFPVIAVYLIKRFVRISSPYK